ncbi:universal stress protein [Flavobacteriaceae bacterium F89]|uniref:Universal stress protein n=1 Tax=Cerina litoralis TaxID=2874477 RepID=A0AAE3ETM8_9FLAO|nr:universal stress protein [Cerina litoralis]MCG2460240.1 universal stress protein [Cerina litoralis]
MKTIIVPVDFSEQSENALKVAVTLSQKHGAKIFALHMLELSEALITSPEGMQQEQALFLIKLAEKRFKDLLEKPYLKGVKITPIIKHFKVFSEVNHIALEHRADLVVMGSHGTDGLEEIFIGSNAEKVVRNSEVPVLVIKDYKENFEIKRIVFACDFMDENLGPFKKAMDFADSVGSELQLVYINIPGNEFLSTQDAYRRISSFLQKAKVGKEVKIYNDYSVEEGVMNYGEHCNADVISIPTHGRKGLSRFFRGSLGENIANRSKLPVLTFKI